MPLQVQQIAEGSTAQRLGLRVGSTLVSIDGNPLHDALDYQFYTAAEHFVLTVCEDGVQRQVEVTKPEYEPFGCDFKPTLGMKSTVVTTTVCSALLTSCRPGCARRSI